MDVQKNAIVKELTDRYPHVRYVFDRFGISADLPISLSVAASQVRLPIELLLAALDHVLDGAHVGLDKLILDYIETRHHTFLHRELPRLEKLFDLVPDDDRYLAGALGELRAAFESLRVDLAEHLSIEEQILFPRLRDVDRYPRDHAADPDNRWETGRISAVAEMEREHELVDTTLKQMRELADDYTPPADASQQFIALYEALAALERDLLQHIHLENDFVWPVRPRYPARAQADRPAPAPRTEDPAAFLCPLTDEPCKSGSPIVCSRFWSCVMAAMDQHRAALKKGSPPSA